MTSSTDVKRSAIRLLAWVGGASLDDLAVAPQHVLVGGELPQAHGPSGVELLGRDSDLGAEPEALTVGETSRGVHDDHGRIDVTCEAAGGVEVAGDDGLGMPGTKAVDVRDRVVERCGDGDGHLQRKELAPEVVVGCAAHTGH